MAVIARIPVELYCDEALKTWHFHVEEPRISGGGLTTLKQAREAAAKAVAFALDAAGRPAGTGPVEYLEVAVRT
jgi:hypothetical protein